MAAMCWFVWVTLLGRRLAPRLEQTLQPDTGYTKRYVSFLAMLGVVAMPAVGLWELVRTGEPAEVRVFRLLIVLGSVFLLALFGLREYIEYHNLAADLSSAVSQRTQLEEERLKLSGRLIHAQEEERSRIARDLHDDLNQRLGLLAFGLTAISRRLPKEEANHVQELWEQATSLSKDVHRLSHELHPSALEHLGLGGAARALCDEVSKQKKVNVEFSEKNIPVQLPAETSLCLFRILQESLNNVCKHSHASVASVKLRRVRDGIRLTVQDDGIGFDPRDEHNRAGLGLLSMNERLRLLGGRIAIDSVPSKGTTVKAWVAINAAEARGDGSSREQPPSSTKPERGESDEPRTGTFG
jgi:signal transduction histidine kinase